MARVFAYVVNGALGDRLNAIHQEASRLGEDLTKERNYMQTSWKRRETHLRQLTATLNDVRGELLALCDQAFAKLAAPVEVTGDEAKITDSTAMPLIDSGDGADHDTKGSSDEGPSPDTLKTA